MGMTVEVSNASEFEESGHHVSIFLEREYLKFLIEELEELANQKTGDYVQYFSKSWGDGDLGETPLQTNSKITHRLKIALID